MVRLWLQYEQRIDRRKLWICLYVIAIILIDQSTKIWACHTLVDQPPQSFAADTIRILYAENPGAFLSLGATLPEDLRFIILTAANAVILFFAVHIIAKLESLTALKAIALAGILAGGSGNLLDRILGNGVVIDFLNLGIGSLRTGIFNVADLAISLGILLLFIESFFHREMEPTAQLTASSADPA